LPKSFAYASCSAHVADTTARLFGLDHRIIRVLYNPIDLAEYPPPDVRKICKGMVVFVGTVYWVKGVFELMEAFRLVKQTHPGCSLYLLGRDQQLPDRPGTSTMEELKRRLPASLADSVHFMGHQPRATVLDYLAKAEVFVLPSYSEGHSNAVTEAQAMGKAIVFGANDAAAEVIEHGVSGLLANPRYPADIALQVCRVLDDTPLRDAMGLAARRLAETKFSIDVLLSANLYFYETTLAKWRDGHRVQGASRNPAKKA